ncbi:EamA family transporter [Paenibacillus sp. GCM10023252]|uniref:EamA family transporter n=1 Tax=Paenibacillus sp. GCM10023252 TaxID=3252649 RepID=UPI00361F2E3D
MWLVTAVGSAILFGLAGWWMKVSQMRGGTTARLLFGLYAAGTAGFAVHAWLEGSLSVLGTPEVWLAGVIIGAGSAWGNALFMKALDYGPASLTSPLTNMNIILVVALGTWYYGEELSLQEAIGIILLLLAVVFISYKGREPVSVGEKRWYVYVGAAIVLFALRNGGLKVTEELGMPSAPILMIAYALSLLWFIDTGRVKGKQASPSAQRIGWRYGLLAGLFSYGGLQLYALALASGPSNLAAPIFATNSLVVAIGAIVVYRERLTMMQWTAFGLTITGLLVIRL